MRDAVMARDGWLCQPCRRAGKHRRAVQVDHVVSLARGGTDDPSNLQAICKACHDVKTQREARGAARGEGRVES